MWKQSGYMALILLFFVSPATATWDVFTDIQYSANPKAPWSYCNGDTNNLLTLDTNLWNWGIPAWVTADDTIPALWHDPYYQPTGIHSVEGMGPF